MRSYHNHKPAVFLLNFRKKNDQLHRQARGITIRKVHKTNDRFLAGEFCVFSQSADSPGSNGGWHRDAVWWKESSGADSQGRAYDRTNPASYAEELEREIWEEGRWDRRSGSPRSIEARGGVGFHLALVDDDCFELVPGSHRRFRTEQEKEAMLHYNGLGPGAGAKCRMKTDDLPRRARDKRNGK